MKTDEVYQVETEFIFSSYNPGQLVPGMKFITKRIACLPETALFYFTLESEPDDEEEFKLVNGAPVIVNIITTGEGGEIVALQDEIGMFDDLSGELRPITDDQINVIINQYGGKMNVECDETGDPIMYEGKVIISYLSNPEIEIQC